MDTNEQSNGANEERSALRRRALLKAAVGSGAAVAAYSVSAVPAYGLTTSQGTDARCYAFGYSSNNPTGKGWMKLSDQPDSGGTTGLRRPNAKETNTCTGTPPVPGGTWVASGDAHSGTANCSDTCVGSAPAKGPVRYKWNIPAFGGLGAFTLTITLIGSMNGDVGTPGNLGTSLTVDGLPTGYCLKWYNSGTAVTKVPATCTDQTDTKEIVTGGRAKIMMTSTTTGYITSLNPGQTCENKNTSEGKIYWYFDVVPCP
jgi:hypothetical protein